jgi:hypothetical protein
MLRSVLDALKFTEGRPLPNSVIASAKFPHRRFFIQTFGTRNA